MIKDLETAKEKVRSLLEKYPQTRDSDKLLWLAYLAVYHNLKGELGESAYSRLRAIVINSNTPTMESVRRVRQKFQEQGQYVGTKRREKLEEADNVKQWSFDTI